MIVRGIIEEVLDNNHAKVRIPTIHKSSNAVGSTPNNELPVALICTLPGYSVNIRRGNAVIVGYENDDEGSPVILGLISSAETNNSDADLLVESIEVKVNTKLPKETSIGDISKESLQNLSGLSKNVENTFDQQEEKIRSAQKNISDINDNVDKIDNSVNQLSITQTQLSEQSKQLQQTTTTLTEQLGETNTNLNSLKLTVENGVLFLNKSAYGTTKPTVTGKEKEGQMYLWIQ
jgi:hypothetical protein